MAREAQDTCWELLFPAPIQSADRCLVTGFTPIDRDGQRGGTGARNFLPIIQPATCPIKNITADSPSSQYVRRSR